LKTIRLILACIIIPLLGSAQHSYTRTYTIDDGLPSNQVNCLYQDSTGYLWIGTDAGIAIFDGTDFKTINKKDGLVSNDVRAITQDEAGNFWFACFNGGLTEYIGGKFTSYTKKDGLHSNLIRRLHYSKTYKTLFIGADDGFYTLKDGKFTFYGKTNGKLTEEHEILWFMEGNGFVYVFPFNDNLIKFYPKSGLITQLAGEKTEKDRWWSMSSALVTSKKDTVWGNKFAVSSTGGYRSIPTPKAGLVFDICEDIEGNVWIPLWGSQAWGIIRFNGRVFEDYTSRLGLEGTKCNAAHFDTNAGILWIGTDGKGLKSAPRQVFTYYPLADNINGKHEYRKLFYYQGVPCLLYKDQIVKFNPSGSPTIVPISILEKSDAGSMIRNIRVNRGKNIQPPNTELCRFPEFNDITRDSHGNLWVSTTVGFYRLSPDLTRVLTSIPLDIRYGHIEFDNQGTLYNWGYWLNALDIIPEPNSQKPPYKYTQYSSKNADLPKDVSQMLAIGKNMLFSSLYGGLYLSDGKTFTHLNKTCPRLSDNVSDICRNQDGDIVYCTNTGEIGIGAVEKGKFIIHQKFDSLDQSYGRNYIWLICDKSYNIYAGTNKGMLVIHNPPVYSSRARDVRFYSYSEGYKDFSLTSPILDDYGNIWLASQDNLVRIDTKAITPSSQVTQRILLTKLETTDSTYVFPEGLGVSDKISWKFPYRSNNITFFIKNINLLNPEKDRFSAQDVQGDRIRQQSHLYELAIGKL